MKKMIFCVMMACLSFAFPAVMSASSEGRHNIVHIHTGAVSEIKKDKNAEAPVVAENREAVAIDKHTAKAGEPAPVGGVVIISGGALLLIIILLILLL